MSELHEAVDRLNAALARNPDIRVSTMAYWEGYDTEQILNRLVAKRSTWQAPGEAENQIGPKELNELAAVLEYRAR